ncbi:MEDS domain-containing protein [Streptomyces nigra]|uniref:MEDS domain-containing protein n=1 Tax=Streptomyces nigra TaxID=1827580 RepID=UPI00369E77A0
MNGSTPSPVSRPSPSPPATAHGGPKASRASSNGEPRFRGGPACRRAGSSAASVPSCLVRRARETSGYGGEASGSEGYRSLRVLHHVTAEAARGGAERLLRSELELEEFAADSGAAVVCAYQRGPWDAALRDKPRCVHPRSDALGRRKWGRRCLSRPWVPAPGRCGPGGPSAGVPTG